MLALALALAAATSPVEVLVIVPLCDGAQLACGAGALGDPSSLEGNLYWGAMYGVDRFLRKQRDEYRAAPSTTEPHALKTSRFIRKASPGEREVAVTLVAYDGTHIDRALADFIDAIRKKRADLVVWAGHDRLMDVDAPALSRAESPASAAVLACESQQYFGPVLDALGARATALTRTFMAPEGYLVDALLESVARHGPDDRGHARAALVDAYARFQKISKKAAGTVFATLP